MGDESQLRAVFALHREVVAALEGRGDADGMALANDIFRKFIAISIASHFEEETKKTFRGLVLEIAGQQGRVLLNLIERKILDRSYHALFDWKRENEKGANTLYSLFGEEFGQFMKNKAREDEDFAQAARDFVALGQVRNNLVHNNLATFQFEETEDNLKERFQRAKNFLPGFRRHLLDFVRKSEKTGGDSPSAP